MVNPRRYIRDENLQTKMFYRDLENAMLLGSIFWYAPTRKIESFQKPMIDCMEQALKFRGFIQKIIKSSTYKDDIYIKNKSININSSIFENEEEYLVLIGNKEEIDFTLELELPKKVSLIYQKDFSLKNIDKLVQILDHKIIIQGKTRFEVILFSKV